MFGSVISLIIKFFESGHKFITLNILVSFYFNKLIIIRLVFREISETFGGVIQLYIQFFESGHEFITYQIYWFVLQTDNH